MHLDLFRTSVFVVVVAVCFVAFLEIVSMFRIC